jgi:hypothetical protein
VTVIALSTLGAILIAFGSVVLLAVAGGTLMRNAEVDERTARAPQRQRAARGRLVRKDRRRPTLPGT